MVGIDRNTGKLIERDAHIRQSIDVILKTPVGTRVMRHEFGFDALNEDGSPKPDIAESEIISSALRALKTYEPRITVTKIQPSIDGSGFLQSIDVYYSDVDSGNDDFVTVKF